MALEGTIKDFPMTNLLQTLGQHKQTGILVINSKETYITIYFEQGMIVNVESFPKKIENRLGETLVKNGLISKDTLDKSLSIQGKTGKKIGEILLQLGILSKEDLRSSLRIQAMELIMNIMNWTEGKYKFTKRDVIDWDKEWFEPISIDLLLMETMQMMDEMPLIKNEIPDTSMIFKLNRINKKIEIIDENEDEKKSDNIIYITDKDYHILKLVDGTRNIAKVIDKSKLTEYETYRALYSLIKKGLISEKSDSALKDDLKEIESKEKLDFFKFIGTILVFIIIIVGTASLVYTSYFKKNIYYPLKLSFSEKATNNQKNFEQKYINYLKEKYNPSENRK